MTSSVLSPTTSSHVTPPSPSAGAPSSRPSSGSVDEWVVHKFGGTSLASAECYRNALSILLDVRHQQRLQEEAKPSINPRLCVVVSAMGEVKPSSHVGQLMQHYHRHELSYRVEKQDKVTNLLIRCTELAAHQDAHYRVIFDELKRRHLTVIEQLINEQMVMEYQTLAEENGEEEAKRASPLPSSSPHTPSPRPASYHYSHSDHGEARSSDLSLSILHMKEQLRSQLEKDCDDLSYILRACWLSRTYDLEHNWWFGYGELWSARLICTFINAVLLAMGHGPGRSNERAVWLDARDTLVLARTKEPMPDYTVSQEKFDAWLTSSIEVSTAKILVVTGYIASAANGMPTTLGRDGSDYSASIFAALLKASHAVIWTDVDGVYSANPTQVSDAVLLDELSYDEASELAYFGAKVLHPKTMTPVLALEIPIWIRNTFNYTSRGSCILSRRMIAEKEKERAAAGVVERRAGVAYGVKGFSEISNLSLIEVKGTGVIGVPGIASRIFSRLKEANCQVILVTQAGSELSMCMAIPMSQSDVGLSVVRREFRDELLTREILTVEKTGPCACLAVVGDGMRHQRGVAGRVFGALADAGVNVQAIAQGSSERNISAIVAQSDVNRALLAVHSAFLTPEGTEGEYVPLLKGLATAETAISASNSSSDDYAAAVLRKAKAKVKVGPALEELKRKEEADRDDDSDEDKGRIDAELAGKDAQVSALKRSYRLFTREVVLHVCLINGGWSDKDVDALKTRLAQPWGERKEVTAKVRLIADIDAHTLLDVDKGTMTPLSWPALLALLSTSTPALSSSSAFPVIIDCTDSELVIQHYRRWLAAGIRLVTRRQLQSPLSALHSLPVFSTLYDLQQRGEVITRVEAILPTPLSFAFTAPASAPRLTPRAIRDSHDSARRMARALALSLGCDVSESSIQSDAAFTHLTSTDDIERDIARTRASPPAGFLYQFVTSLDMRPDHAGGCAIEVKMRLCPQCHPFGWLKGYNSSFMVYTAKFPADAMVIQGPVQWGGEGAGGEMGEVEEGVEREKAREREASGVSEQVEWALGQFHALVSQLAQ